MTSEVQGECRAELARAMLSRSLHSQCISNALQRYEEIGTLANIRAKTIIFEGCFSPIFANKSS